MWSHHCSTMEYDHGGEFNCIGTAESKILVITRRVQEIPRVFSETTSVVEIRLVRKAVTVFGIAVCNTVWNT